MIDPLVQPAVLSIVQEVAEREVQLDTLFSDMKLDSLDLVKLIMEIESYFGLEVPDEEIDKITCPRDVVELVERKRDERTSSKPVVPPQDPSGDGGAGKADEKDPRTFPTK